MRTWAAAQAAKGSPNAMPMPNPRQSIYALRGWIDRIEQDARADAAKKYGTLDDAKPATPPEKPEGSRTEWGARSERKVNAGVT